MRDDRLVDPGQPAQRHPLGILAAEVVVGGVRRHVVEQPAGLVLLDPESGQLLELAGVVPERDDLGLDPDPIAGVVGDDVELVDVEAKLVEPLDPLLDAGRLCGRELLLRGQLAPQRGVPLPDLLHHLVRLDGRIERAARLQVEDLGEDVLAADGDVVLPHLVADRRLELAGLGVDEVRRELARVPPKEDVGQGDVAPEEVGEVQPDQQHDQRVHHLGQVVGGGQPLLEQRAVGQREAEMGGQQGRRQFLAVVVDPAGDHALGDDRGQVEALELAEQAVLPEGDVLLRLLDRVGARAEPDDAYDVAGQAARQGYDVLVAPFLERSRPRQRHHCRVRPVGHDPQGHGGSLGP